MKVHLPGPAPRVAFVGAAQHRLHAPSACSWATARFFEADPRGYEVPRDLLQFAPSLTVVFGAQEWTAGTLSAVPGLRIGVVDRPLYDAAAIDGLKALCAAGGFRFLTYPEAPPPALAGLPLLQQLPLPIDLRQVPEPSPELRWGVCVPEWAKPSPALVETLVEDHGAQLLSASVPMEEVLATAAGHGILVYSARDALGRFDPLPRLAMAAGLLLVTDTVFPPEQGIEREDEYLSVGREGLAAMVDEVRRLPSSYVAVRVRARQKMRECFDADVVFKRLAHDALLLGDPALHLHALQSQPATAEADREVVVPLRGRAAS